MSPASYLTAPPRVAAPIIARASLSAICASASSIWERTPRGCSSRMSPTATSRRSSVGRTLRDSAKVWTSGTSAVRDADNGEAFLGEVEWSYGFKTRLLSGDEEAVLTCKGVANGRPLDDGTLVLDIGGRSTELITAA